MELFEEFGDVGRWKRLLLVGQQLDDPLFQWRRSLDDNLGGLVASTVEVVRPVGHRVSADLSPRESLPRHLYFSNARHGEGSLAGHSLE